MNCTRTDRRQKRQDPTTAAHLFSVATLVALALSTGCTDVSSDVDLFAQAVYRIPLGADEGTARFFAGFPTESAPDQRSWWYLRPEPAGPTGLASGLSALVRFDDHKSVVEREVIEWASAGKGTYRLRSEWLVAGDEEQDEADFATILGDKLGDLARADDRYRFNSQETACQFLGHGVLLLSMDRWARPGSRLTSLRGEIDATAHPKLAEAVRLAWQIRRFAIELNVSPRRPRRTSGIPTPPTASSPGR